MACQASVTRLRTCLVLAQAMWVEILGFGKAKGFRLAVAFHRQKHRWVTPGFSDPENVVQNARRVPSPRRCPRAARGQIAGPEQGDDRRNESRGAADGLGRLLGNDHNFIEGLGILHAQPQHDPGSHDLGGAGHYERRCLVCAQRKRPLAPSAIAQARADTTGGPSIRSAAARGGTGFAVGACAHVREIRPRLSRPNPPASRKRRRVYAGVSRLDMDHIRWGDRARSFQPSRSDSNRRLGALARRCSPLRELPGRSRGEHFFDGPFAGLVREPRVFFAGVPPHRILHNKRMSVFLR